MTAMLTVRALRVTVLEESLTGAEHKEKAPDCEAQNRVGENLASKSIHLFMSFRDLARNLKLAA
jgi:hypothetical protein